MRRFPLILTGALVVLTAGTVAQSGASATPLSAPTGLRLVLDDMNPVQDVAICFYIDGWNGPGLYDCGYRHRHGHGWHGRRDERQRQGHVNDRHRRGDFESRDESSDRRGRR